MDPALPLSPLQGHGGADGVWAAVPHAGGCALVCLLLRTFLAFAIAQGRAAAAAESCLLRTLSRLIKAVQGAHKMLGCVTVVLGL